MAGITEFKEEYNEKVNDYLQECQDDIEDWVKTDGDKSTTYEKVIDVKLPTVEGFALFLGFARSTLYKWAEENSSFSDTLEKISTVQKQRLIEMGLAGKYNPAIAKLMLSSNHDMREKSDTTSNGKQITITFDEAFDKSKKTDAEETKKD